MHRDNMLLTECRSVKYEIRTRYPGYNRLMLAGWGAVGQATEDKLTEDLQIFDARMRMR